MRRVVHALVVQVLVRAVRRLPCVAVVIPLVIGCRVAGLPGRSGILRPWGARGTTFAPPRWNGEAIGGLPVRRHTGVGWGPSAPLLRQRPLPEGLLVLRRGAAAPSGVCYQSRGSDG